MALILTCKTDEQFLITVPPSDKPTEVRLRTFMRGRRNGGPLLSTAFEAAKSVAITRQPVAGGLAQMRVYRPAAPPSDRPTPRT